MANSDKREITWLAGAANIVNTFGTMLLYAIHDLGFDMSHVRELLKLIDENKEAAKQRFQAAATALMTPVEEVVQKIVTTVSDVFRVAVTYTAPTFEALEAHFTGYVNPDFRTAQFEPIERLKDVVFENGVVNFVLVHLGRNASTDDVLAELDRLGYRPATFCELIAFALAHPGEQLKYPIAALGSFALLHHDRYVACLDRNDDRRGLGLNWVDDDWNDDVRFLAVRK